MKRYDLTLLYSDRGGIPVGAYMELKPEGKFVQYSDCITEESINILLDNRDEQIDFLQGRIQELVEEIRELDEAHRHVLNERNKWQDKYQALRNFALAACCVYESPGYDTGDVKKAMKELRGCL